MTNTIELAATPKLGALYVRAALGAVPAPGLGGGRGTRIPDRAVQVTGVRVDPADLAEYTDVCDLRLGDTLPLTYPFVLAMPTVMRLLVAKDFPFSPIGLVHAENVIERTRPISVGEALDVHSLVANLREHPKGLLADAITEIRVGRELVWRQVMTFLHQQRTSLSGGPKPEPKPDQAPPPPLRQLRVAQRTVSHYAAVSGDRNPIHVTKLGARALGFPSTIAHGSWTMATVLGAVEGRIADAVSYRVKFGKPVTVPATVNVYAAVADGGWDLSLKHPKKGYPHLSATLR
jgi:acyl dehydratase